MPSRWAPSRKHHLLGGRQARDRELLDEFGVGFIEGGWPGAMPKDTEFFERARSELNLKHAVLVAFGSTRKAGVRAAADPQVRALLEAETPAVCLVAKSTSGTWNVPCAPRARKTSRWCATPYGIS